MQNDGHLILSLFSIMLWLWSREVDFGGQQLVTGLSYRPQRTEPSSKHKTIRSTLAGFRSNTPTYASSGVSVNMLLIGTLQSQMVNSWSEMKNYPVV